MRIIMIGCEHAGKTTLAEQIHNWMIENMGPPLMSWHDHFVLPFHEGSGPEAEEEANQVLTLMPTLLEKYSRYMIDYHFAFFSDAHNLLVNWYYGDAVYAPLYYGYGNPDDYLDRRAMARSYDAKVMKMAPDTVLVLVKASPEVIRRRMSESPHPRCILKDEDVEFVLQRFEEEYNRSGIRLRFTLDTTNATLKETFGEFLRKIEPHLNENDKLSLLTHEKLMQDDS